MFASKQTLRALVSTLSLLATRQATAQESLRSVLTVPEIPGDSLIAGYYHAIDIISLSQSLVQQTKKDDGYCRVDVIKGLDVAGPLLWMAAATDRVFPEVRLDTLAVNGTAPVDPRRYEIRLTNAHIENMVTTVDAPPVEKVTFAGTSATLTYYPPARGSKPVTTTIECK